MSTIQIAILENGTAAIVPEALMYLFNEGDYVTTYNKPWVINKVFLIQSIYDYKTQSDASFISLLLKKRVEPKDIIAELKQAIIDKKIDIICGLVKLTEQVNITLIHNWANTSEEDNDNEI